MTHGGQQKLVRLTHNHHTAAHCLHAAPSITASDHKSDRHRPPRDLHAIQTGRGKASADKTKHKHKIAAAELKL